MIEVHASRATRDPGYNRRHLSPPSESSPPMYNLARQLLFKLSPETSHDLSIDLIGAGGRLASMACSTRRR